MTNKKCTIDDCVKESWSRGYCRAHYKKFIERPKKKEQRAAEKAEGDTEKKANKLFSLAPADLEKVFLTPCRSQQELKTFIKVFFNLHLPDCKVSRYADSTPFHAIWEVYDICVNKNNLYKVQELLYVAGRGSGKTLAMAIAELLVLLHDQRDVVHVGAIQAQAQRCYEYQQKFLLSDIIRPIVTPPKTPDNLRILEKSNMYKSHFNVKGEKTTLEVLPCTLKACLLKGSEVIDNTGKSICIELLKIGDFILSKDGLTEVKDLIIQDKQCLEVELDDGRVIRGTLDHKVYTNYGWIELNDLTDEHEVLRYL